MLDASRDLRFALVGGSLATLAGGALGEYMQVFALAVSVLWCWVRVKSWGRGGTRGTKRRFAQPIKSNRPTPCSSSLPSFSPLPSLAPPPLPPPPPNPAHHLAHPTRVHCTFACRCRRALPKDIDYADRWQKYQMERFATFNVRF